MLWLLLVLLAVIDTGGLVVLAARPPLAHHEITFLIISQSDPFHRRHAHRLRQDILDQSQSQPLPPRVLLTHEDFADIPGAWAVTPLLLGNGLVESAAAKAANLHWTNDVSVAGVVNDEIVDRTLTRRPAKWLVVCDASSRIDMERLVEQLERENHEMELFLGHGLHDQEATIVHHFAFFDNPTSFRYPTFRAGIALSWPLVQSLRHRTTVAAPKFASEFAIDAGHELAMFIWDEGRGHKLTEATYFCLRAPVDSHSLGGVNENGTAAAASSSSSKRGPTKSDAKGEKMSQCAVYSLGDDDDDEIDGDIDDCVTVEDSKEATCPPNHRHSLHTTTVANVFFAVKTWTSFHVDRVPIIKNTWAKQVKHIRFYSDVFDPTIPTIDTGVPNTDTGHCQKMINIFGLLLREIDESPALHSEIQWIVLADDDTLLSLPNLLDLLRVFNASTAVYLGERYGFRLFAPDGLNYVTGGGGIVLSLVAVRQLLGAGCECPTRSAPDDMILGVCMRQLGIESTHSERFHQARPTDYPNRLLTSGPPPISFHKYWQIDPYAVYTDWLFPGVRNQRVKSLKEFNIQKVTCSQSQSHSTQHSIKLPKTKPNHSDESIKLQKHSIKNNEL